MELVAGIDWGALLPFIAIGFLAQLVDGSLGMAFGIISSSLLVGVMGVAPARASAGVHLVEMFTTGASGLSHVLMRNVDWRLFARIAVPGMIGGAAGAFALGRLDAEAARPLVMAYLSVVGVYLLWRALRPSGRSRTRGARVTVPLGLVGGFLDASGGGGWGPVVTSNLLLQGEDVRRTVGTVNSAEFLVTLVVSLTFVATMGLEAFTVVTGGLLMGGMLAAPLGAVVVRVMRPRALLLLVGLVLTATSGFNVWRALA